MADARRRRSAQCAVMTTDHTELSGSPSRALTRWMQFVGAFYVLNFVAMAIARAPIRTFGPDGALARADAGDPIASFLVDTWVTFGLEVGAVGVAVLIASRHPLQARGVVWTVLAIELVRGILNDLYFIARGINVTGYLIWVVIHLVIIVTGLVALRLSTPTPQPTKEIIHA